MSSADKFCKKKIRKLVHIAVRLVFRLQCKNDFACIISNKVRVNLDEHFTVRDC